jgi:hypothetical protein
MGTGSGVAWDRERKSGSSSNYAIAFAPIISANWNAPDAERPEGSAGQLLRFTVTPLYPTAKH